MRKMAHVSYDARQANCEAMIKLEEWRGMKDAAR
jgi:hypothetical protein